MTGFSSFHTHTSFCDGKNTPEEMVQAALALGCPAIGFSGHSYTPFDPDWCMSPAREAAYRREVLRLREAYGGKIAVYLGLEQDYYSPAPDYPYDYIIGSVHYVKKNGEYLSVDDTPQRLRRDTERLYGGDYEALAEDYYALVAQVPQKTGCRVVGHFDLITKFNDRYSLFREDSPRYRAAALGALHSLQAQKALLEVNTGAISRGWKQLPYPAPALLEEMGRLGMGAIITTDAHRAEDLACGIEAAAALLEQYHVPRLQALFP